MDALKNGVSLEDVLDLMKDLDKASTSVYRDHGRLEAGKDEDYNQYIKELENEKE